MIKSEHQVHFVHSLALLHYSPFSCFYEPNIGLNIRLWINLEFFEICLCHSSNALRTHHSFSAILYVYLLFIYLKHTKFDKDCNECTVYNMLCIRFCTPQRVLFSLLVYILFLSTSNLILENVLKNTYSLQ